MDSLKSTLGSAIMVIIAIVGINYKESILSVMGIFELIMILISLLVIGFIWIYHKINSVGTELKNKIILLKKIHDSEIKDISEVVDNNWKAGHIRLEKTLSLLVKKGVKIEEEPVEKNPELQAARKMQQNLRDHVKELETEFHEWKHI